ncbi:VOC family protein [Candidatus Xianfuyuplasma coldseepsis]|uniref:Glyoxalase/bleomycin resistance/extradiol dioxygenase family protein n=1 Tax=Candidatus Xianfuyuplasma coldseepsis TaxID=2782163 RepID=A0A7L7KRM5_9MOLU|nr:glyoxalase/bleomycin resistance/extradiol dioxygenase family protein [Xianfuyuplasma coldseepsis]QMS84856.1 glyoxalase/bleomycin resistance/extradiol dioxygenase family protein [Xianfuyuplasma coldseepsis]
MSQFLIPYVMFEDTMKAVEYYNSIFGGEVRYTMMGKDMPNCPEEDLDKVMHLEYVFNDTVFYFGDLPLEDQGRIQLHLNFRYEDAEFMEEAFNKMKKQGTVIQELKEEFWGAVYGNIKDPFGVTWQFHRPAQKR